MSKQLTKGQSIAIAYGPGLGMTARALLAEQIDKALAEAKRRGEARAERKHSAMVHDMLLRIRAIRQDLARKLNESKFNASLPYGH